MRLDPAPHSRRGYRSFVQRFYTELKKTPNSAFPHSTAAPVPSVLDIYDIRNGYLVQREFKTPHRSNYMRVTGGTTLHWLATCLRMLPTDLRLQSEYGIGCEWPITNADKQPYYRKAEWEIGVSGDVEEQRFLGVDFAENYQFPMEQIPQSYWDQELGNALKRFKVDVAGTNCELEVRPTPAGRNSIPRDDVVDPRYPRRGKYSYRPVGDPDDPDESRQRCVENASCIPICPVHAKYSAIKSLRRALDDSKQRVVFVPQAVASELEIDSETARVTAVRYKRYRRPDYTTTTTHVAKSTIFVLAAHAIETAKLLLASHAANSSDMVGRNLMDHPTLLTWGLYPKPIGNYRGPGSTSGIPQLRDGGFRKKCAAFRIEIGNWGWAWPKLAPYKTLQAAVDSGLFGEALHKRMADEGRWQFRSCYSA